MDIDNIEICLPMTKFINFLIENQFEMVTQKVSDYHFHEVYIELKTDNLPKLEFNSFAGITRINENTFNCQCHWSIVKILSN